MVRRTFALLLASLALAACAGTGGAGRRPPVVAPAEVMEGPPPRVAILLPLTGPRADIGQSMLKAAQLALGTAPAAPAPTAPGAPAAPPVFPPAAAPGTPVLDARDTGGTPEGAAGAARQALAGGAALILGPLTAAETAAVAPVTRPAGVPVLAFTNDQAQAQPGVWTLGITPLQQVTRLVEATRDQGRSRYAGLFPDTDFGRAMGTALLGATASLGLPPPVMRQYARGSAAAAARDLSEWDSRNTPVEAPIDTAQPPGDPDTQPPANGPAPTRSAAPPPFDVLLLADTGQGLTDVAAVLPTYGVAPPSVRIVGPALWASPSSAASKLVGAWYAAPDPAARATFDASFRAHYASPAPPISDLAFDAASIARVLAGAGGYSLGNLTQPTGFSGADGVFVLGPDGQVRRGLAVFEIGAGPPVQVAPAPAMLGTPPGV
ncbi:MAG: penicillin-binding protein activator [Acetobacteraceae bacterium]|nr:penicillin-binding protein activator [Acetobacteraceae bacterium]